MKFIHILAISAFLFFNLSSYAENPETSGNYIKISKERLTLTLLSDKGDTVRVYPIACAKNLGNKEIKGDSKTPEGTFIITQVLKSDILGHDFGDGKGIIRGAYGPWFLRLSVPGFNDIGIHGTHLPESIGSRCTEGCIRMTNDDIADLKNRVSVGTIVIIEEDLI